METNRNVQRQRRTMLVSVISLVAARPALAHATAAESQPARKLAKSDVHYTDRSPAEGRDCDDCRHFIPGRTPDAPGSCRIVEGPISPHGHCAAFVATHATGSTE